MTHDAPSCLPVLMECLMFPKCLFILNNASGSNIRFSATIPCASVRLTITQGTLPRTKGFTFIRPDKTLILKSVVNLSGGKVALLRGH